MRITRVDHGAGPITCPYCRAGILSGEEVRSCARCSTKHHAECALEVARCTVMGCGGRFAALSYKKLGASAAALGAATAVSASATARCFQDPGCLGFLGELVGELFVQGLFELLGELLVGLLTGL